VIAATRRSVFITGASSGIGLALAREFAARGCNLALTARRTEAMEELARELQATDPTRVVYVQALDVTRYDDVSAALQAALLQLGRIDIVIANAGMGSRGRVGHGHFHKHRQIMETNVLGAMATSDAAVRLFKQQGAGRLVVIASVAAFRGLPGSSAYSASKAAIATYADAVRTELYGTNIGVCTIYPGYIDTPINQDIANRPFVISAARGAKLIADKIERGVQSAIVPAWPWLWVRWLAKVVPTSWLARSAGSR
jgi:short-subunit dehydrogenase